MRSDIKPISVNPSTLAETTWYEYAMRFFFGGLITAVAGIIAKKYGPEIGGLFLAFPAIFPAGATLIEKHEREHKEKNGFRGVQRARKAVAADAAGAAMGCVGLVGFALVVWQWGPQGQAAVVITCATLAWVFVSGVVWIAWKRNLLPHCGRKRKDREQHVSV
jgi:hypothetical protein